MQISYVWYIDIRIALYLLSSQSAASIRKGVEKSLSDVWRKAKVLKLWMGLCV